MSENLIMHMVGNAHIDPVWLWRLPEGLAEIKATFRSALDRLDEYQDFVFTASSAAYYQWVEDNASEMFEEIKARVSEGRWIVAGGFWVEPDCNIPCGESFARQSLYSQRYFQKHLGCRSKAGYNVDSFGHNGMMPQILKKSGMDFYVFMRPDKHEKPLPQNLFWWEGVDGSRVRAFRLENYATFEDIDLRYGEAKRLSRQQKTDFMFFYGVGNHGGGPTIKNIEYIHKLQSEQDDGHPVFSSPNQFFESVVKNETLPVVHGDLQYHSVGCYSSLSLLKNLNRKSEQQLLAAEKFAAMSEMLFGYDYNTNFVENIWRKLLFNQFHDLLGGCLIKSAYRDALESYGSVLYDSKNLLNRSLQKISWAIDTSENGKFLDAYRERPGTMFWECEGTGTPVVVFNSLSWDVEAPVQVNKLLSGLYDDNGMPVLIQKVRGEQTNNTDLWNTLFIAKIPAMGYRVYRMHFNRIDSKQVPDGICAAYDNGILENAFLRVAFSQKGEITSIYDKQNQAETIPKGKTAYAAVLDESHCDTWAHDVSTFDKEIGRFDRRIEMKVLESGPLRAVLRFYSAYGNSTLRQDFILYRDKTELEVDLKVNWREKHKMLKLRLPISIENPGLTSEIPYGSISRAMDGTEQVGQKWVDISGKMKGSAYGVAVLNNSSYAFSATPDTLSVTVLRSPIFADHFGKRDELCEFTEQGEREFRYAIIPHTGNWILSGIPSKACEFNMQFPVITETFHKGPMPMQYRGVEVEFSNILVQALKKAEDGEGYILRCNECTGRETWTSIAVTPLGRKFKAHFEPYEIKTFRLSAGTDKPVTELLLTEYPIT